MRRLTRAVLGSALLAALAAGGPTACSGQGARPTPDPVAGVPSVPAGSPPSARPPGSARPRKPSPTRSATARPHPPGTPVTSRKPVKPAASRPAGGGSSTTSSYPWHTGIVATTFWVGEIFDPNASDGSQVLSTYDSRWLQHYGGCDGRSSGGDCRTERRTAANDWFPTSMTPKENPFYLDLPFDDVNDRIGLATRAAVVPWAREARYASILRDREQSLMKNRWVELRKGARTCFGQIQDAGPGEYSDAAYVFGSDDARPRNQRYGGAGMDVSPAINGCLGFAELNGDGDRVSWRFVDEDDVPPGPWTKVITTSGVH